MTKINSFKNIIFDLGGVLINIYPEKTVESFKSIDKSIPESTYERLRDSYFFDNYEKGLISEQAFLERVKSELGGKVNQNEIINSWNFLLGDFPEENINLIEKISKTHRIFLLSNTNITHYKKYISDFENKFGYDFNSLFEKTYYSFEHGLRKPDIRFYKKVIYENNLKKNETLFIEDTLINRIPAIEIGIQTVETTMNKPLNQIIS